MARPRSGSAVGREWERHIQKMREEARHDFERRKHEDNERMRAHLSDLPFRDLANESITHHMARNLARNEGVQELDAGHYNRLHSIQDAPFSTPAFEDGSLTDTNISELQRRVNRQEIAIKGFESDLRAEQAKVRCLQAERHEAVSAHRQAILVSDDGEIEKWKTKVSNLLELLDQSTDRQQDLERQIGEGRVREQDLRDRLHNAQRRDQELGASIEVQEPRETPTRRRTAGRSAGDSETGVNTMELRGQLQETHTRMSSLAQRHRGFEEELDTNQSTTFAPSSRISGRTRKQAMQMEGRGYISMPKASGRRVVFGL